MRVDLGKHEFIEELVNDKVRSYTVKNGCEEGDNVAGSLKKIEVITQEGKELTVIFKIIPENAPQWIIDGQIFRTEHCVYRSLIPLLKSFASNLGFNYEPPTPKYFTGFNNDKDDYICLEDVRPSGFIMPDKFKSFTLAEMSLVMKELAKFHAVSYAFISKQGKQFFETGEMRHLTMPTEGPVVDGYRFFIELYYEESTKIMKKRNPEAGTRMEKFIPTIWDLFSRTMKKEFHFKTIIHTDLWVNNLLIKYVDNAPSEVKFIDFQFVQQGNILQDIQYLIFTSTTPEFRKDHLLTVLNVYYDHFSSTLDGLKCSLPQITRGILIDEFYECFLPGFIHMTFAIPLQLGYCGTEPEGNQEEATGDSHALFVKSIHDRYLKSPAALSRLDALVEELIQMKLL